MKINAKNIALFASVGCLEHEYSAKTKLLISVQVEYSTISSFTHCDDIINYANIVTLVKTVTHTKHFVYIEELAVALGNAIKMHSSLIKSGMVKVQKCIMEDCATELSCECLF